VSGKHLRVLQDIFTIPVRSNIDWRDIEKMLIALGAEITEGSGSRVRISLPCYSVSSSVEEVGHVKAVFHRHHPRKETDKGAVVSMRRFLVTANITPEENDL
jgi:hypothetical protein